MPVFETPEPISVTIDLAVGDVRLDADNRTDTVVEVRPTDLRDAADVKAAEETRVEYVGGKLFVRGPKLRSVFGRGGSVDVTVELPAGSEVRAVAQVAAFHCSGRLGDCQVKTGTGDIQLQETGPLIANTSMGDVTAERVDGPADVSTGSGAVRVAEVVGAALIKNSNGESWVGEVTGDLRMRSANGVISVGTAHAAVDAKSSNGDIRIGEIVRGSVVLGTASGHIDIGIRTGTAALLHVRTRSGTVYNFMTESEGPQQAQETVEVFANTSRGDIAVRRT
jgi:hypothetical protein